MTAPVPPPDDGLDAREALPRLVRIAGEVIAPATLLTALLFQFGRLHSAGYFRHFGVNFSVLDLSVNDHLISGADGLFVPLAGACALALVLLLLHRVVAHRLPSGPRWRVLRLLAPAAGAVGAVLVALALLDLLTDVRLFWGESEAGGLGLAVGVLLVVYAVRLVRAARGTPRRSESAELAEWAAAFLLVSVGLYWAVGSYALGVGTGRALQLQRALPTQPAAVLYSERSQSIDVPGVVEVRCADPEAAYRFRYDGLRLVRQAGNQYLLVPATWTRATGSALLIPRGSGVRLEFRTATAPSGPC
ncbi:hypothetical protein [Blastococcus sp. TF02A-30]|uniref:hypothetical protein n=1 Tax=Blastococcus sp. TF02A-30 TaxID=2250580 RepID=UPI000DE84D00|nr:hypothetical protein [Blastococcus sp. TF02A-30]RBY92568.1 hypothetical protein DQ241_00260 [Blastococcus sp. TF02A-30]